MTDLLPSLIRTLVPIIVGPLVARFGFDVTDPDNLALVSAIISWCFYTLVRIVETRWPQAGYLLGVAKQPAYSSEPQPSPGPGEDVEAVVVPDGGFIGTFGLIVLAVIALAVVGLFSLL